MWFIQAMRHPWAHLDLVTELWLAALVIHLLVVVKRRPANADSSGT